MALFWAIGISMAILVIRSPENANGWSTSLFLLPFAFIVNFLSLRLVLPKACKQYPLRICKNNNQVSPTGAALFGLSWGLMWRIAVVSMIFKYINRIAGSPENPLFFDITLTIFVLFLSSIWLLKHQLGSITIDKQEKDDFNANTYEMTEPAVERVDALETAKEGTAAILTTVAVLSYFAIGIVQIAAIVSFFNAYWGWWLLPSILVASFVAYIPLLGALAGMYAAIEVWNWAWYWAVLLFFFPIILGVLGAGLAGFIEIIISKLRR